MNAPERRSRRQRWAPRLRALAVIAFFACLICVPLAEKLLIEKAFALTIVCACLLIVLFASARLAFSLLTISLLTSALAIASLLKLEFMLTPVLAPDLTYYLNAQTLDVVTRYPILLGSSLGILILVPLILLPAWWVEPPAPAWRLKHPRALVVRACGLAASIAVLAVTLSHDGPFTAAFDKPMWATITDRSYLTAFFTSFNDTEARLPTFSSSTERKLDWRLDTPLKAPAKLPDIVAVLEESTFDPRILNVCTIPECRFAMFDPDADTRSSGLMTVHTFGGGTWTSEFALETGIADVLFGNAGLYATYSLAPRIKHTLPKVLKAAGYRVIAVYSHSGDFLNARNAYEHYGFDMFYDGEDLGLGWDSTDADLLNAFRQIYASETEAHPDQPLFFFTLTLHQHGPHMTPLEQLPPPYNRPLFPGRFKPADLDAWLNLNLGNYLQRAALSDQMLTSLQDMLWHSGRPTALLHFGDHQPSFDGAMHAIPKTVPKAAGPNASRVTYYMLRTSFPMKKMPRYEALDITYLGSLLLDVAGVPKDAFYQANTLLRDRCKGRYLNCADRDVLASYHDFVFHELKDFRETE